MTIELNHDDLIRISSWTSSFATVGTLEGYCPDHAAKQRDQGCPEVWSGYTGSCISSSPSFYEKHRAEVASAIVIEDGDLVTVEGSFYRVFVIEGSGGEFPRNSDPVHFVPEFAPDCRAPDFAPDDFAPEGGAA
jgi:hypothetical protein